MPAVVPGGDAGSPAKAAYADQANSVSKNYSSACMNILFAEIPTE